MPHTKYGLKNRYRPSALTSNAYGWTSGRRPRYRSGDVPAALLDRPSHLTAEQFRQQFAYEWYGSKGVARGYSNPPFVSGAAGRILPSLGGDERILRGFIRRAETEAGNEVSKSRLYFMYNPEIITRDYVSYLNQTALDPFNTVYQSNNLVAPPSILDFTFSLFFDRQEEAIDDEHPGVFVDYEFFDLVVRNVVPTYGASGNSTLPDNGVMMVNPREVSVVFSPQITVQGRPLNARVTFLKFTHRMVPTRMQIDLTIRATYLGPLRKQTTYVREENQASRTIPLDVGLGRLKVTYEDVELELTETLQQIEGLGSSFSSQLGFSNVATSGGTGRLGAMNYSDSRVDPNFTKYDQGRRMFAEVDRPGGPKYPYVDCSSLVGRGYRETGQGGVFGESDSYSATTAQIWSRMQSGSLEKMCDIIPWDSADPQPGDILYRLGHMAFFFEGTKGDYQTLEAMSASRGVGKFGSSGRSWTHVLRPNHPAGASVDSETQGASGPINNPNAGHGAF